MANQANAELAICYAHVTREASVEMVAEFCISLSRKSTIHRMPADLSEWLINVIKTTKIDKSEAVKAIRMIGKRNKDHEF